MSYINNKLIKERADKIVKAWEEVAKTATFSGLTLAAFLVQWEKCENARKVIALAELQRELAAKGRDQDDAVLAEFNRRVGDAVKADPDFGPNSPLYRAMGYVPYDERSSGLTRKEVDGEADGEALPPDAAAAA